MKKRIAEIFHLFDFEAMKLYHQKLKDYFQVSLDKKLDVGANAASASKLAKPVLINGVEFDGTKDIEVECNTGNEKTYNTILEKDSREITIPEEFLQEDSSVSVYIDGIKLVSSDEFYTFDKENKKIILSEKNVYSSPVNVELVFKAIGSSLVETLTVKENLLALSDIRLKENFTGIDKADLIKKIKRLQIYNFNFKGNDEIKRGCIAQEVKHIFPEYVKPTEYKYKGREMLGVSYTSFIPDLLVCTQFLLQENEELKQRLDKLESKTGDAN